MPAFKSASCKHQFVFNTEICSLLQCILDSDSLGFAKEKAKEGLKKLTYRNKLVRLADSSPGGWATVAEYEKPVIGSDSDDEKKINKAEARAVKKLKSNPSNSLNVRSVFNRLADRPSASASPAPPAQDPFVGPLFPSRPMAMGVERQQFFRPYPARAGANTTCFACGRQGHFRRECEWVNRFQGNIVPRRETGNPDRKPII